ncbi:hypothetical protein B0A48_16170 [Cryoendolithus antarcticus]|uniref:NmrA-like domain-containing protein n=1 Tax=Cryoendolithus antarcticus TaxID=1507870 RepID=A0A1V8SFV6_9PEZI|nr:hypothetical protein B0A48_16170 [Cryoendolithus antarcticus]
MAIKRVTLLGADGELGPAILTALLHANFEITVLKRANSSSPDNYPSNVKVAKVDEAFTVSDLTPLLRGQDALVITIKGTQVDLQRRLADAAIAAGVQRLIPADFGSCDSASAHAQELVPLFGAKTQLRSYLTELAEKHESFSWTAVVGGHFFDWRAEFLHLYPKDCKAEVLGKGDVRSSYSTLSRVGEATVKVLGTLDETKNRVVYVQSFNVTQSEILKSFEKASGKQWDVETFDPTEYEKTWVRKRDEGDKEAIENLVFMLGALESDWTKKQDFAMKLLGLEDENLDQVVSKCWEMWK